MEQIASNTDEITGVERRQSAPGRVETLLHGSCPKCHHWHDRVRIWLSQDPNIHNDIKCQNEHCQHKMFGLGGNSSHFSLLSRETIQPGNQGAHVPLHCTNDFTIYAAVPAAAASALAAPTPTIANSLDHRFPSAASQNLLNYTSSSTRETDLNPQTTTQSEPLTRPQQNENDANLRQVQTAPELADDYATEAERSRGSRKKRFRHLRSTTKRILAFFGVEVLIRRIPRNGVEIASPGPQEATPPQQCEPSHAASGPSSASRRHLSAKSSPAEPPRNMSGTVEESQLISSGEHSRSETLKGTNTGDARNSGIYTPHESEDPVNVMSDAPQSSNQTSSPDETSPTQGETSGDRCGCPLEPAAREAWIKQRRHNLTREEEQRDFCKCTPSCACYKFHDHEASSNEAEATSSAARSDRQPESEADTARSSFSRASSSALLGIGAGVRSAPASRHDSIMSESQTSHHQHEGRAPIRSSTGSTQNTSSSNSSHPSSGSQGPRPPRRTSTLVTNMTMSDADDDNMTPLAESQEPPLSQSPVQNSEESETLRHDGLVNGHRTPPPAEDDEDIEITPTATRSRQTWPRA